jgi:hypothetical protein
VGVLVLISYFIVLAVFLFFGVVKTFTGFLVFLAVALIGVVIAVSLGRISKG